ncbi:UBX domain-containing protein 4 [Taenia solium]|eukprot:TsM_000771500 transcript=TsM_000771500 gene=TsM_000771500
MNWYSGDIGQCIKDVKTAKKLLLVFLNDGENVSNESLAALNSEDVVIHCQNMICLQLKSGSIPYHQFESVYEVPSLPCIHLISPSGLVLSVKTTDFSVDQIASWLAKNIASFETTKVIKNDTGEMQECAPDGDPCASSLKACAPASPSSSCTRANASPIASAEHAFPQFKKGEEVMKSSGGRSSTPLPEVAITASPLTSSPPPDSSLNDHLDLSHRRYQEAEQVEKESSHDEIPSEGLLEATASVLPHQPGNSLNERIEHARQLLEAKRQEKAVKAFQEAHESELKRRDLGRDMAEFKRRKQEQEIRERIEEQKREKAERQAARQRILAQIELDRRDRQGLSAPTAAAPRSAGTPVGAVDPNEVRLQLRLPDGSYMVGVFAADAHLGSEVRQYIISRVQGTDTAAAAPLSDVARASFAPVLASGFTFRQTRPNPPRHFSPEDETTKTLRELDLWPSAVLMLHSGKYKSTNDHVIAGYSQNVLSRVVGLIWGGVQSVGDVFFYFGGSLIQLGRSAWQVLFSSGSGRTVGQAQATNSATSRQSPSRTNGEQSEGRSAYRRQGKISRLSHMPDDTDEQARWNGNSTTQL